MTHTADNTDDVDPTIAILRSHRYAIGLSQRQVARSMGTQQSAISELECGVVDPTLGTLRRYADVLGAELTVHISSSVGGTTTSSENP